MALSKKFEQELANLTPFQRTVLLETAKIPRGEVRTYAQIAKAIGRPKAVRAVGNALGANPCAPMIPCHRVVRSGNGGVGGYSAQGGTGKKLRMLRAEGVL